MRSATWHYRRIFQQQLQQHPEEPENDLCLSPENIIVPEMPLAVQPQPPFQVWLHLSQDQFQEMTISVQSEDEEQGKRLDDPHGNVVDIGYAVVDHVEE